MNRDVLDIEAFVEKIESHWMLMTLSEQFKYVREIINELIQRYEADPRATQQELDFLYQERAELTKQKLNIDRA